MRRWLWTREVDVLFSHGVVSSLFYLHDKGWKERLSHNTVITTSWSVPFLTSQRQAVSFHYFWLQFQLKFPSLDTFTSLRGRTVHQLPLMGHIKKGFIYFINKSCKHTRILRIVHLRLRITEINFINLITTIMTIL